MNIKKTLLLTACFLISQSFTQPSKEKYKPFSKKTDTLNEELNPKFFAYKITKLLYKLQRATPAGYRFNPEIAVAHFLNNLETDILTSETPYYIKIN